MIVAVGSDKGAPGATTLATVLALAWPGDRVLCELDPRGADLPFRLMTATGQHMAAVPSIATLAVDSRPGAGPVRLHDHAQLTALHIPVIRGEVTTRASSKIAAHLPGIAALGARWPATMIADLGSLQPWNPALAVARSAAIVLLVIRANTEGLGHLRARVEELAEYVGDPTRERSSVGVVVVTDGRDESAAVDRTRALLGSIGSPVPVVGAFAQDPAAAQLLWASRWGRKLTRSALVRSTEQIIATLRELWPREIDAATAPTTSVPVSSPAGPPPAQPGSAPPAGPPPPAGPLPLTHVPQRES